MTTDVEKSAHESRGAAPHDDRIFRDIGRAEITGPGNLTLVTQIHPAAREHHSAFLLVDLRIDVNRAADEPAIGVHQSIDVCVVEHLPVLVCGCFLHCALHYTCNSAKRSWPQGCVISGRTVSEMRMSSSSTAAVSALAIESLRAALGPLPRAMSNGVS